MIYLDLNSLSYDSTAEKNTSTQVETAKILHCDGTHGPVEGGNNTVDIRCSFMVQRFTRLYTRHPP